ncbi:MAG TPA: DNA-3-methyladenine glycosylase I [Burkholderiales bacterium]|nr:DNA-3-methyladenine glycosylase I [Burkholderiales bacterium]
MPAKKTSRKAKVGAAPDTRPGTKGVRAAAAAKAPAAPERQRCSWCLGSPAYMRYHDEEWGVPVHNDRTLFEFLILEGAQAGLSWSTILAKRERYRKVFADFDPARVARFGARDVARLMQDPGIVRNRLKIESTLSNAKAFLAVQKEFGSFDRYVWSFVGGRPLPGRRDSLSKVPASTPESDAMSKDLKKRGFRFVGSTICYAFMQAVGMVNDHVAGCWKYRAAGGARG